jgi:hypothetical protein
MRITATLVAPTQISSPIATPMLVNTPPWRPPARELRMVRAVSGPGVQVVSAESAMNPVGRGLF